MYAFDAIDFHEWVGQKSNFVQANRKEEKTQC